MWVKQCHFYHPWLGMVSLYHQNMVIFLDCFTLGKSPFFMGKSTISMAISNSYVTNYQRVLTIDGWINVDHSRIHFWVPWAIWWYPGCLLHQNLGGSIWSIFCSWNLTVLVGLTMNIHELKTNVKNMDLTDLTIFEHQSYGYFWSISFKQHQ